MNSAVRPVGRLRRVLAAALLVGLPLAATTACAEDEGVGEDGGIVEEEEGVVEDE